MQTTTYADMTEGCSNICGAAAHVTAGDSNAYDAGESPTDDIPTDAGLDAPLRAPITGDGRSLGDPFCLVRFICRQRSG